MQCFRCSSLLAHTSGRHGVSSEHRSVLVLLRGVDSLDVLLGRIMTTLIHSSSGPALRIAKSLMTDCRTRDGRQPLLNGLLAPRTHVSPCVQALVFLLFYLRHSSYPVSLLVDKSNQNK